MFKYYIKKPSIKMPTAASRMFWSMPELCAAYDWPRHLTGGGVIGIIELGGGHIQSDMDMYFSGLGQPRPSITDISVDGIGSNNGDPTDPASAEVTLDIQIAAAANSIATGKPATIRVYWAANAEDSIMRCILQAARDGCDVCCICWGMDEALWSGVGLHRLGNAAHVATKSGMVIFAASGDNGSSDGGPTPANVDAPASAAHIIGCGGTSKLFESEVVWNNSPGGANGEGTGGGYSTYFKTASATWQTGIPSAPLGLGRMVPDVAANADPNTGIEIVLGGQTMVFGGTSVVAPLWAGLVGSFGKKLGFITPTLYDNQEAFNDITIGNNGMYRARVGPDPCTGMGSPRGKALATLFAKP